MAWAYTVLARLNLTRYKANAIFAPTEYASGKTSSRFNQYLQGDRAPKQIPEDSTAYDIVREVERLMKTSEATDWLNHPFWRIFASTVSGDELVSYMLPFEEPEEDLDQAESGNVRKKAFGARGSALFMQFPPADLDSLKGTEAEPRISSFDDFVHLCAMFRLSLKGGYWHGYWQLFYLSDRAAELNDVFRFIRAPFFKMLEDYYGSPDWMKKFESESRTEILRLPADFSDC